MTTSPPPRQRRRAAAVEADASAPQQPPVPRPKRVAVIGAGMAGVACARTLVQAGCEVEVFEREALAGGRMASERTPYGRFDSGAQYFTVRDERFTEALRTAATMCKRWSANAVRVLDRHGRVAEAALPTLESHWVALPGMDALVAHWAAPLGDSVIYRTQVTRIEPDALDADRWQLRTAGDDDSQHVYSGYDLVLLAIPPAPTARLLQASELAPALQEAMAPVAIAPCWTLMIAFPQATQPTLGPQWNAARSTHHRVAWLARESSKPGRDTIERWTLQASADWSQEHLRDDSPRIKAKLLRAFSEITGIHATPSYAQTRCWPEAKTQTPLGRTHLFDPQSRIGIAGDWCIGHRVEDAFVSGLSLALDVV